MHANRIKIYNWIKGNDGKLTSCSENVAELQGADSPKQMIGKSDYDLLWRDRAPLYYEEDAAALRGQLVQKYQTQNTIRGEIQILVCKSPLFNRSGDIVGTVGSSIDLTSHSVDHKFGKFDEKNRLHLGPEFANEYLTSREVEVLRLLLLGRTGLRIADELGLSRRTVESYIIALKLKLQCETKGDIIATCFQYGLTHLTQKGVPLSSRG